MTCTGLVKNFAGLMIVRILLGIFEYVPSISDVLIIHAADTQQSWFLPRRHLPLFLLVHAQEPFNTYLVLLLR